jgi:hypothetical protein
VKSGRILLFNPKDDDRPLYGLSEAFELALSFGRLPTLYRADANNATDVHWLDFRENIQRNSYREEIRIQQKNLIDQEERERHIEQGLAHAPHIFSNSEQAELEAARAETISSRERIGRLQEMLIQAPAIIHIEMQEHKAWLRKALEQSESDVVIISPWIKARVLDLWLPLIKQALHRGCEIWIGHGMPRSVHHKDNSDESALAALDQLARDTDRLHLVPNLGTHEKILICDERYFITTSYNWLSFDGRSAQDRYEHGVVQSGYGVAVLREQFIERLRDAAAHPVLPVYR